jgi:hypothetical protein
MVLSPKLLEALTADPSSTRLATDPTALDIAQASTGFLQQLAQLTGNGVVPGTPQTPEFHIKFPSMEERARRRAERRAANSAPVASGSPEDERTEVDPQ